MINATKALKKNLERCYVDRVGGLDFLSVERLNKDRICQSTSMTGRHGSQLPGGFN